MSYKNYRIVQDVLGDVELEHARESQELEQRHQEILAVQANTLRARYGPEVNLRSNAIQIVDEEIKRPRTLWERLKYLSSGRGSADKEKIDTFVSEREEVLQRSRREYEALEEKLVDEQKALRQKYSQNIEQVIEKKSEYLEKVEDVLKQRQQARYAVANVPLVAKFLQERGIGTRAVNTLFKTLSHGMIVDVDDPEAPKFFPVRILRQNNLADQAIMNEFPLVPPEHLTQFCYAIDETSRESQAAADINEIRRSITCELKDLSQMELNDALEGLAAQADNFNTHEKRLEGLLDSFRPDAQASAAFAAGNKGDRAARGRSLMEDIIMREAIDDPEFRGVLLKKEKRTVRESQGPAVQDQERIARIQQAMSSHRNTMGIDDEDMPLLARGIAGRADTLTERLQTLFKRRKEERLELIKQQTADRTRAAQVSQSHGQGSTRDRGKARDFGFER